MKPIWQVVLSVLTAITLSVSTVYTTFATKAEVRDLVQQKHESVSYILGQILDKVNRIEERVWDLSKKDK